MIFLFCFCFTNLEKRDVIQWDLSTVVLLFYFFHNIFKYFSLEFTVRNSSNILITESFVTHSYVMRNQTSQDVINTFEILVQVTEPATTRTLLC